MPEPLGRPSSTSASGPPGATSDGIPAGQPTSADDDTLGQSLESVVLGVAGVTRLEPTIKGLARTMSGRLPIPAGTATGADAPDGITIITRGPITDVTIDIATTATHQALATADAVGHLTCSLLAANGREPGQVTINVLSIDFT